MFNRSSDPSSRKARLDSSTCRIIVEKFGGTSVGSIERINAVADHLIDRSMKQANSLVVVVSAMSGETNRLIKLAHAYMREPAIKLGRWTFWSGHRRTGDHCLIGHGICNKRGNQARSYTGGQVSASKRISVHSKARILGY